MPLQRAGMAGSVHTIAAWRERGVIGLEIPSCSYCGATTKATWEETGTSEDVIDVADRALTCELCDLSSRQSDVAMLREGNA